MHRRAFLRNTLAAPLFLAEWKSGPPKTYLDNLKAMMRAAPVPGAVIGCIQSGKLAWIAPLGVQSAATSAPVTAATLFQAASLTKQLTAYCAFALRDRGKLDFDRPLVEYIDDLANPQARTVTPRNVLSHSSGFPNWRFMDSGAKTVPDLVPAFAPGSKFQYSGEGFFYLQRIIEKLSDAGIAQVFHDTIFQPLGMTSSVLTWDPETLSRTAIPHDRHGEPRKNWDRGARGLRG